MFKGKSMARPVDKYIKDVVYEKYFVIQFQHRDDTYMLCEPEERHFKFIPITKVPVMELKRCKVMKFQTEEDAKSRLTKIPNFDISGYHVDLEIGHNTMNECLVGA